MDMDLSLIPPVSILMVVGILKYLRENIQRRNKVNEFLALENLEERAEKLALLAGNRSFDEQSWTGWMIVPFVVLTLLGSFPAWIVYSFWTASVVSMLNEVLALLSAKNFKSTEVSKSMMVSAVLALLTAPLVLLIEFYTIFRAMSLL